ncbi:hypothetical protein EOL96_04205 [Candidatus Saccharibacteria bacterium]|nr:hypothetical protein [Candidatus Saccharibacteria bacterium]
MKLCKNGLIVFLIAVGLTLIIAPPSHASSLRIQPAIVHESLGSENKKGYIDVINSSSDTIVVAFRVQAARQIDNNGNLEFYDDSAITKGITLDYNEVSLAGREAIRLYYVIDSAVLPAHDIMAAIFARIIPEQDAAALQVAQVGTVLVLERSDAPRQIEIPTIKANFLQLGDAIEVDFTIKNTAQPINGFMPKIQVDTAPYGSQAVEGPLVAAGKERPIRYQKPGNFFGPMMINISSHGSTQNIWVMAATGYWRWLAPLLGIVIFGLVAWYSGRRRNKKKYKNNRV